MGRIKLKQIYYKGNLTFYILILHQLPWNIVLISRLS